MSTKRKTTPHSTSTSPFDIPQKLRQTIAAVEQCKTLKLHAASLLPNSNNISHRGSAFSLIQRLQKATIIPARLTASPSQPPPPATSKYAELSSVILAFNNTYANSPLFSTQPTVIHDCPIILVHSETVDYTETIEEPRGVLPSSQALDQPHHQSNSPKNIYWFHWCLKLVILIRALSHTSVIGADRPGWTKNNTDAIIKHTLSDSTSPILPPSLYHLLDILSPLHTNMPEFNRVYECGVPVFLNDFMNLRSLQIIREYNENQLHITPATAIENITIQQFQFFLLLLASIRLGNSLYNKGWYINVIDSLLDALMNTPAESYATSNNNNDYFPFGGMPDSLLKDLVAQSVCNVKKCWEYTTHKLKRLMQELRSPNTTMVDDVRNLLTCCANIPPQTNRFALVNKDVRSNTLHEILFTDATTMKNELHRAYAFSALGRVSRFEAKLRDAGILTTVHAIIPGAVAGMVRRIAASAGCPPSNVLCLDVQLMSVCASKPSTIVIMAPTAMECLYERHTITLLRRLQQALFDPVFRKQHDCYFDQVHVGLSLCALVPPVQASDAPPGQWVGAKAVTCLYTMLGCTLPTDRNFLFEQTVLPLFPRMCNAITKVDTEKQRYIIATILLSQCQWAINSNSIETIKRNFLRDCPEAKETICKAWSMFPESIQPGEDEPPIVIKVAVPEIQPQISTSDVQKGFTLLTQRQKELVQDFLVLAANAGSQNSDGYWWLWYKLLCCIRPIIQTNHNTTNFSMLALLSCTDLPPGNRIHDDVKYKRWTYVKPWTNQRFEDAEAVPSYDRTAVNEIMTAISILFSGWDIYTADSEPFTGLLSQFRKRTRLPRYTGHVNRDGNEIYLLPTTLNNDVISPLTASLLDVGSEFSTAFEDLFTVFKKIIQTNKPHLKPAVDTSSISTPRNSHQQALASPATTATAGVPRLDLDLSNHKKSSSSKSGSRSRKQARLDRTNSVSKGTASATDSETDSDF